MWKSGAVFKGEPELVMGLTAVPFDVACLANNHVLDYGVAGLRETLAVLHRHDIQTVGAGLTEPRRTRPLSLSGPHQDPHRQLQRGRGPDGVAGRTWRVRLGDRARRRLVRRCRTQGGVVIAIGHCGLEYVPYPPPYVEAAFRAMVDAGADAVIGHHPHVPQGVEWHHGRPIIYSLGNFVFYQRPNSTSRGSAFCVSLLDSRERASDVHLLPYRITDTGVHLLAGRRRQIPPDDCRDSRRRARHRVAGSLAGVPGLLRARPVHR